MGLCSRCEWRARFREKQTGPYRYECKRQEYDVHSCYQFRPTIPPILAPLDPTDLRPRFGPAMISSRETMCGIAPTTLTPYRHEDGKVVVFNIVEPWAFESGEGPRVYIAGPMRGKPGLNFATFHRAARILRKHGYRVFDPARADELAGFNPKRDKPGRLEDYMRRDLQIVAQADILVLLPGWKTSQGATRERTVAEFCGVTVMDWPLKERKP